MQNKKEAAEVRCSSLAGPGHKYNSIDTAIQARKFITETKKKVLVHDLQKQSVKDSNLDKMNDNN